LVASTVPSLEAAGQLGGAALNRIGLGGGKSTPRRPISASLQACSPSAAEGLRARPWGNVATVFFRAEVASLPASSIPSWLMWRRASAPVPLEPSVTVGRSSNEGRFGSGP